MLEIPDEHGDMIVYVTATEAPAFFGDWARVTSGMVAMWRQRRMVTPYRIGREVYYRLGELKEVEWVTRNRPQSHRGRST